MEDKNLLLEFIKSNGHLGKRDLIKLTHGAERSNKIDTDYPYGYGDILRQNGMHRLANAGALYYDYNVKSLFGELGNINDEFVAKLIEERQDDHYFLKLRELFFYLKDNFGEYFEDENNFK